MQFGTPDDLLKALGGKARFEKDDCPFCSALNDHKSKQIIWKSQHWAIIHNKYPYTKDGKHVMLVPIRHIQFLHQVTPEEWQDRHNAERFLVDFFAGQQYFSFTRETLKGGRSVEHIHTHYILGKIPRNDVITMLGKQDFQINL